MGTISAELVTFKEAVDGKLDGMSSKVSELSTKISGITDACNSAKSGIASSYQGDGVSSANSTIDSLVSAAKTVESSVSSTVQSAISEANAIVADVTKLEELNKEIESVKTTLNNTPNTDENKSKRNSLQSTINSKEDQFKTINDAAVAKLAALKSKSDSTLGGSTSSGVTTGTEMIDRNMDDYDFSGGTLQKYTYKASNGKTVSYYMYVPNNPQNVKLPMTIYFHGMHETIDKYPDRGLAGLVKNGKIQPKGIIIFPQADNGTSDKELNLAAYHTSVLELTKKVANEHNGDMTRLSVAGHSNGACAAIHMVNNNPGVFAACAPISGTGSADKGICQTNLWCFVGSNDSIDATRVAKGATRNGSKTANYTVFKGKGHDIQGYTFEQELEDKDGNKTTLLDWLMSKKLG